MQGAAVVRDGAGEGGGRPFESVLGALSPLTQPNHVTEGQNVIVDTDFATNLLDLELKGGGGVDSPLCQLDSQNKSPYLADPPPCQQRSQCQSPWMTRPV